jgi:hypothetical protein
MIARSRTSFEPHWHSGFVLVMFLVVMALALLLFVPWVAGS